jgi:hypothetical protein
MGQSGFYYQGLWASYVSKGPAVKEEVLATIRSLLPGMPISIAINMLDGAPNDAKRLLWREWVETVNLSGYTIDGLMKAFKSEPPDAVYEIIRAWLTVADLSLCSLTSILKIDSDITLKDDKLALWRRWVETADLTAYDMLYFITRIKNLHPDIIRVAWVAWMKVNDASIYPYHQRRKVSDLITEDVRVAGNEAQEARHV